MLFRSPVGTSDERTRAERGVELVAGERDVVDVVGRDVDRRVRRELRRVHDDASAVTVRERDTMKQDRTKITKLKEYLDSRLRS